MSPSTAPAAIAPEEIVYPDSDGSLLGETGIHVEASMTVHTALTVFLEGREDAYVASNMFLYYEEGNPQANRSPDCMVCLGVAGNHIRKTIKTWVEGVVPSVIFEYSSPSTIREDLVAKRTLYARLGVGEYFLFDPIGDCLNPRFRGFRLAGVAYEELTPGPDGSLTSEILGLRLIPQGILLRFLDLRTGRLLPTYAEANARANQEYRRAEEERRRSEHLEAELARLRALLDLRDETGGGPNSGD